MNVILNVFETPSGKDSDYENFPVGSWLLPAPLRPHVFIYYRFARAIDDIADNPDLSADDKIIRLNVFADTLKGTQGQAAIQTALNMRASLLETGVPFDHCLDLIKAFKQDAVKSRYQNWQQLIDYCLLSAAPVGRYLIDLHGGSKNGYEASDALCCALQIINHMQDCADDFKQMDRVYLPENWMDEFGATVDDLNKPITTPALRRVLNKMLKTTEHLMIKAAPMVTDIKSRRLAMESGSIIAIANRLIIDLTNRDPLAGKVKLNKFEYISCCVKGTVKALVKR